MRIDDYPGIVMRHGRQAGLMVLRATAQFLGAAIRDMDMVAEYDETTFALLLPGADLGSVVRICEHAFARPLPAANCLPPPEGSPSPSAFPASSPKKRRDANAPLASGRGPGHRHQGGRQRLLLP